MVGSWYLTHATNNVVWIFTLPFFVFVLQRKMQGSCMGKHENKRYAVCRTKSMLNAYAWWCNDSCKMWCWNMITGKCRNDMFIMMPWRDAYAMHDMNAFYGHESPKIYLFLLAHSGAQCPMCAVKKVIWTFRLPVTKDETNIQRMRDDMMQMHKSTIGECTHHGNILK